jgi:pimeloyl-ACP methyl ester carboxylesterase
MAVAAKGANAPPEALTALIERFDRDVIDVPGGRARIRLEVNGEPPWNAVIANGKIKLRPAASIEADAELAADEATWARIAADVRGGMEAFRKRKLTVRKNLHLGVGFLAATSGITDQARLRFDSIGTPTGRISTLAAGRGPLVLCVHGLGGTKASFLPTVAALAEDYRVVAMDLPGFGESVKPIGAPYDAPWFAKSVFQVMDELGAKRAHLIGNSMGGRVAIEAGLMNHERVRSLTLLSPALAWLRERRWVPVLKALRPELGLLQLAPKQITEGILRRMIPGASDGWAAAGVDEFLRSYFTPRGRAAFYAAARNIYLDEPHGEEGFWTRLPELAPDSLFIWGRQDAMVPIAFMKHVERALPAARHVELDCGHVPQLEAPGKTHAAIRRFLAER